METVREARFYNTNGVAIVAVITEGVDWSAYIGALPDCQREEDAVEHVTKHGCKLNKEDAKYYFKGIELPYRE
uniref:Uncharacterized protein n=1 Tax=Dictyoglomus turgidum TaxID=513050 RepID=A0A7C3WXN8_9BACT